MRKNDLTVFWCDALVAIPEIQHEKGVDYSFSGSGPSKPWEWQQMVKQLGEDSRRLVVQGADGKSRGITSCSLQKTLQYDHKRHHAAKALAQKSGTAVADTALNVWDFALTRDDGSYLSLHPNYSNTKVQCKVRWPKLDEERPKTGPGGTSGRGTYQYFIKKEVDSALKFDVSQALANPPALPAGVLRHDKDVQGDSSWQ